MKKYEEILLSISPVYLEFNVVGIPDDKMEILIKNKIIPMVEDTLVFMRENYEDVKMKYIKHDLLQYTEVAIGSIASVEEVKEILKWDVSSDIKINILSEIKEKISVVNCNYSEEVIHYILMNNLDTTDLPFLFQKYDIYAMEIQSQIETIAKKICQ